MAGVGRPGCRPAEAAVAAVRERARVDVARILEIEDRTHHDVLAFTESVAEQVGDGEHSRWFHYGLTSSDVGDTALALQLRDAGELILAGIDGRRAGRAGPRRGVSPHPDDRPHPRRARRADHLRSQAARLGDRAAPPARAAADRLRRRRRRQALRRRRRLRQHRPAGRGARPRGARAASARTSRPRSSRATATPRCSRAIAGAGASLERFAARDAPPAAHRGARGARAVRQGPEGLVGDAAQAEPDRVRAHLRASPACCARTRIVGLRGRRRCGTSATSPTPPPSGWSCPTRPSPSTTCSTSAAG